MEMGEAGQTKAWPLHCSRTHVPGAARLRPAGCQGSNKRSLHKDPALGPRENPRRIEQHRKAVASGLSFE